MKFENTANISKKEFAEVKNELANHKTLGQILIWATTKRKGDHVQQIVVGTITQDEYTIDVIIRFRDLFLVFDTT